MPIPRFRNEYLFDHQRMFRKMLDLALFDKVRRSQGLRTLSEISDLIRDGNVIYDPFSVLISGKCKIGTGNILYPCISLVCADENALTIGNGNVFFPSTSIAAETGAITIGADNQFGEGGFTARTNRPDARIQIGDSGRYLGGASIFGHCEFGSGSQVLGAITVDNCRLEGGESHGDHDPQRRGGLLKGIGFARSLEVPVGHVIAGNGQFTIEDLRPQAFFHPVSTP
jgi:hypothetical protein